jgi:hypothetical protein
MSIQGIMLKLKIISANSFTSAGRAAPFIGLVVAAGGPFMLIALGGRETSNLPWYVWTIMLLLLLLVIGRGRYMFMLDSREAESISISPRGH